MLTRLFKDRTCFYKIRETVVALNKEKIKFVRFLVYVPQPVLDFAKKHGIELDIQQLTLSAIAGYFNTFASLSPGSRFPLTESRKIAKLVEEIAVPKCNFCPFCLMFSVDEVVQFALAQDCGHCNMLLNLRSRRKKISKGLQIKAFME